MEQSPIPPQPQLDQPPAPESPRVDGPRRHRWLWLVALAGGLAASGWLALPWAVGLWVATMMEQDTGVPVEVAVADLTPEGLVMAPLVLGDDLSAERVVVRWHWPDLLAKRLDEVTLSGVRVRAQLDTGGLSLGAIDRLIDSQHMKVARLSLPGATADVALPWGVRHIRFDAEKRDGVIRARGDVSDLLRGQPLVGGDGSVELTMEARRTDSGSMTAEMALSGGPLSGTASLQWARGHLHATLGQPLALTLATVPPEIAAAAPAELRALLSGRLTMSLRPIGPGPHFRVLADPSGRQEVTTAMHADLSVAAPRPGSPGTATTGQAAVEVAGTAWLAATGWPERLDLQRLSLELTNLPYGETRYDGALRLADLAGEGDSGAARLRVMLLAHRFAAAGLGADEAALSLTGRVAFADGTLSYALSEPGSLYLKGARAPGVTAKQPVVLTIEADGRFDLAGPPGARLLSPRLTLSAPKLVGDVAGETLVTDKLRATIAGTIGSDRMQPTLEVSADSALVSGLDLALKRPVARLQQTPDGPRLTLTAEQALQGGALPLALTAWLEPRDGRFAGALTDAQGRVDLQASGQLDPVAGKGSAKVSLKPVTFRPGGLQPSALFPNLAKRLQDSSGSLAVNGTVSWDRGTVRPDLDLLIKDGAARLAGVTVRKVNSVIKLTGLDPPTSPPGQMLAVAVIDAGLPLTDGQLSFHLADGRLMVEQATTRLAGGHVAVGEFVYDPTAARPQRFSLEVSALDLGRLVELIDLDGLTATGQLSGNVPLSLRSDHVTIDDARLISVASGAIRYRPKEPPAFFNADESTRLVLKAFDNFEYDKMTMTLNGTLGGDLTAGLHITGGNPELYGGYPIEFNLNLSGKLDRIIDEALVGYQIPDQIKERMSWFGAR